MSSSADFIELTSSDLPAHSPVTELAGELLPEDPLSHPAVVAALAAGAVTLPPKSRSAVTRGRPATEPQAGPRSRAASRRSSPGPPAAAPTSSEAAPSIQELTRVLAAALAKAAPTPPPSILDTVVPPPNFSGKDTTPTEFNEFAFQLTRALRQRHLLPPTFDLPSPLAPACNPAASTVAKVYPVKQVTVACAFFAPFFTCAAQLMPAGAWDVLPYRCACAVTGCCACVWLTCRLQVSCRPCGGGRR